MNDQEWLADRMAHDIRFERQRNKAQARDALKKARHWRRFPAAWEMAMNDAKLARQRLIYLSK